MCYCRTYNIRYSVKIEADVVCSVGRHGDHCCSSLDHLRNSRLHWLSLSPQVSDFNSILVNIYNIKIIEFVVIYIHCFVHVAYICCMQLQARCDGEAEDARRRRYRRVSV